MTSFDKIIDSKMSFQPRFSYTHSMAKNLGVIEAARAVIDVLPLPPDQVLFLLQAARQRATRNSTRIEGNTLNSVEVGQAVVSVGRTQSEMQQEVRNYWRALEWIEEELENHRAVSEDFICELHCIVLVRGHGRRGQRSKYRTGECPVVDNATKRIDYVPPKPGDVPSLMSGLLEWLQSKSAAELPGPVRAGLLAHRFVSIHPFSDGNGRTTRALATTELWHSGYDMRGFLSLEEYYNADINAYYNSLQMGLPVDFYEGRNDPDHTRWLDYFLATMAQGAEALRRQAVTLFAPEQRVAPPWERLRRVQQQLLTRLVVRCLSEQTDSLDFSPSDVAEWYGISATTAREWLEKWREETFVQPTKADAQRVRAYILTKYWEDLVREVLNSARVKKG